MKLTCFFKRLNRNEESCAHNDESCNLVNNLTSKEISARKVLKKIKLPDRNVSHNFSLKLVQEVAFI